MKRMGTAGDHRLLIAGPQEIRLGYRRKSSDRGFTANYTNRAMALLDFHLA
jgi:hypothetical protein